MCQFRGQFCLYGICSLGVNKCLHSGFGRRVRAANRRFCRGTSILAHLSVPGYGQGCQKTAQLRHTLRSSVCVCWCSSEKDTMDGPVKKTNSWVTPLFSTPPSYQTSSATAGTSIRSCGIYQSTFSSQRVVNGQFRRPSDQLELNRLN